MAAYFDIVLITEDRYADPPVITDYISNILKDDEILSSALEKRGLRVVRKSWSDTQFDWASAKYGMFRTTWDYFRRRDEFFHWIDVNAGKITFINHLETIRWNLDKHYLADLQDKHVRVVGTIFIETGDTRTLNEICSVLDADDIILKPAISGAAWQTFKFNKQNIADYENQFRELISNMSMLVQPFQKDIIDRGEVALMVIGGKFTHAVLKKAKPGDFRVQDDFGGTLHDYLPSAAEIAFAEEAVRAVDPLPLYARVDIVIDNDKKPAIMELELIEPELWFRRNPVAAELLADEVLRLF